MFFQLISKRIVFASDIIGIHGNNFVRPVFETGNRHILLENWMPHSFEFIDCLNITDKIY